MTKTITTPGYERNAIHSTDDLIAVSNATGGFFFSPKTMSGWDTRVLSYIRAIDGYKCEPGGRYVFITSDELGQYTGRLYSVRLMTLGARDDGRARVDFDVIERYPTRLEAMRGADIYVSNLPV